MPQKYYIQLIQDLILTVLLLSLMAYHLLGEIVHEWLGLAFIGLIFSHTGLNLWWFKKLRQGDNAYRLLQTGLNGALILLFLTASISGILLSKHIFAEMPFHLTDDVTRKTHMLSVHWIQIVIAMHVGLHWKALAAMLGRIFGTDLNGITVKWGLPLIWSALALYGLFVFYSRDLFPYLVNNVDFAFFDSNESAVHFYADYFAILIFFAYATRVAVWLALFRRPQNEDKK